MLDVELPESGFVRNTRSPSHPIAVSLGTTSLNKDGRSIIEQGFCNLESWHCRAQEGLCTTGLREGDGISKSHARDASHDPWTTCFNGNTDPEVCTPSRTSRVVYVCDRSGSIKGPRIEALRNALKILLKSLPVGVKFDICSIGDRFNFFWTKSAPYPDSSLDQATYGGTEMFAPMEETINRRYKDMNLEIFLVTDGQIWNQERLSKMPHDHIGVAKAPIRVFTLGNGDGISSSLIEGVARAGNGFSQTVSSDEKLDGKVIRMLKGALSPHADDYKLAIKYSVDNQDDFEAVDVANDTTVQIESQ